MRNRKTTHFAKMVYALLAFTAVSLVPGYAFADSMFELPLNGTGGYALVEMTATDQNTGSTFSLSPGEAFTILGENDDGLLIKTREWYEGTVPSDYVLVNLPDIIPSIIYYDTNSEASLFMSSGYSLDGITGEMLYDVNFYSGRYGTYQYVMPVLYPMAEKIMAAQKMAQDNGESLMIYETYRPHDVQSQVGTALSSLASGNAEVNAGINTAPWNEGWFIALGTSNHQRGCAMDVSLVQVNETETAVCGGYYYTYVTSYTGYDMPTAMHELSYRAATFSTPVSSADDQAWRYATPAAGMTDASLRLQQYCTDAGMTPLASEWWHFNDLDAKSRTQSNPGTGEYRLTETMSTVPD